MLTISIRQSNVTDNAGFIDRSLVVVIAKDERNDIWIPLSIFAVDNDAFKLHIEQILKGHRSFKGRYMCCRLEVQHRPHGSWGLYVPHDEQWPFRDFDRIAFELIHPACVEICCTSQQTDASITRLWRKP